MKQKAADIKKMTENNRYKRQVKRYENWKMHHAVLTAAAIMFLMAGCGKTRRSRNSPAVRISPMKIPGMRQAMQC